MAKKRNPNGIDQRSRGNPYTSELKSAAGRRGAQKLIANARAKGLIITGVSRLPAADDADVAARIEMLGQLEDAVRSGKAPMRDVVMSDRVHLRLRVTGARKVG